MSGQQDSSGFKPSLIVTANGRKSELRIGLTGFWFIDQASEYEPPLELEDFLGQKQLPLCFGFGSMTMPNPEYLTHYIVEALKKTHQGGIILSGWGDVGRTVNVKDSLRVFVIEEVPHDWLFPQVSVVVHHGGASTTAAVSVTCGDTISYCTLFCRSADLG